VFKGGWLRQFSRHKGPQGSLKIMLLRFSLFVCFVCFRGPEFLHERAAIRGAYPETLVRHLPPVGDAKLEKLAIIVCSRFLFHPATERFAPMRLLDLITPKDLSRVAKLQLLARQVVEGTCNGRHRSPHKGFSVEFKEHRPYVSGDELSKIDWKVYAKSDRLYIREFEEETNLRCTLLVDRSGSMRYSGTRSEGRTKYDYAQQLSASLAYLMLSQQDAVGAVTFDNQPREIIPPRSRPSHLRAIMTALAADVTKRETDLGGVFSKIASKLSRRGLVVIVSDAMGDIASIGRSLAQFRSSNHEILFFQIMDPDEVDFPFSGRIQFRDLENVSNEHTIDARSLKQAYLNRLEQHDSALRDACRKNRVDLIRITTDRPFADVLHEYMALRRRLR
jgi:uncharacterized protein (DUF58 family)